ncbi:MAG: hypothetical protein JO280_03095 [Mycobacteriaceae bacterium]|nr:hypothetical protein [Mycobacteriaceae bacterium]
MTASLRFCCGRRVVVVLASGAAISLTAISGGIAPALAGPVTTTVTPTPAMPKPSIVITPPPAAPPIVTHQAPVVTHEAPVIPTTAPAPVTTAAPSSATVPAAPTTATVTTPPPVTTIPGTTTPNNPGSPTTTVVSPTTSAGPPSSTTPNPSTSATATTGSATPITKSPEQSTVAQSTQVTPTQQAQKTVALPQDIEVAKNAIPVQQNPGPASQADIKHLTNLLTSPANTPTSAAPGLAADQKTNVKQWDPAWVQTDQFYRPVIINPYNDTLQVVFVYDGAPRVLLIPPLASAVTELAELGVYNFTAMVLNAAGVPTSVAVGTMYGGGYEPVDGEPPPAPPPPPVTYNDVPVQVQYSNATYQPFVVHQIVDAGMDSAVGEEKVLLDGVTPAWGEWVQGDNGQRQFEVHKTQQFPGLDDAPGEGPLPGDYQLQLTSAGKPAQSGLSTRDLLLIGGAGIVLLLAAGAILLNVMLGRRQPRH